MARSGAQTLADLTTRLFETSTLGGTPDQLAFVLDGETLRSTGVSSPILAGEGQIDDDFTKNEISVIAALIANNPIAVGLRIVSAEAQLHATHFVARTPSSPPLSRGDGQRPLATLPLQLLIPSPHMSAPTPPKRPRIFYGWYIIGLSGVSAVFAGTTSQAFFGVFLKPIEDDTGWTRASIAGAVTIATFVGGGIAIFIGYLADRYGPRVLMTIGVLTYAAGYAGMLLVTQVWQLYIAFFLARMASLQFLAGVVPRTTAVNWFRRMRGRALGFQTMAMPLGGAGLASVAGALIAGGMPWRVVLAIFGLSALAILAVPLPLFMRRQPEDMGLLPDGDAVSHHEDNTSIRAKHQDAEVSWTLQETLRTKTMWLVVWGSMLQTLASGGIAFHMTAHFQESGLSTQIAAAGASAFLLGGALSSTLWGFLTERYDERMLVVAASAVAMVLAFYGSIVANPIGVIVFSIFFGATTRGEGALVMMMIAAYYGRRSFGAISGFVNTFTMMGLGIGPYLYAAIYDTRGAYEIIFYASGGIMAVATLLMWLAKRPSRRPEPRPGANHDNTASARAE